MMINKEKTRFPSGVVMIVTFAVLASGILTLSHGTLAQREDVELVSKFVDRKVPLDPNAAVWEAAPAVTIPLSPQSETVPRGGGATQSVSVKSLNDGKSVYFLLEWEDSTKGRFALAPQEFRDACAIQFPEKTGQYGQLCMGLQGSYLNVWHWMSDWQEDLGGFKGMKARYPNMDVDYYPAFDDQLKAGYAAGRKAANLLSSPDRKTAVEELIAGGAGALAFNHVQNARGKGVWKDGKWKVVISRAFHTNGERDTSFEPGLTTATSVAVWDGGRRGKEERSSVKSVSNWFGLKVGG